jgi:hypothetical protein
MVVGFSSLGSFSSRFRELVGTSPSAYQRRQVALGGPPPIPGCYLMAWSRPRPSAEDPAIAEKPLGGEPLYGLDSLGTNGGTP